MPIYLHGLSLKNFRGIGPIAQDMAPFKEFNFFVGANNAGKSIVLDFISRVMRTGSLHQRILGNNKTIGALDKHLGGGGSSLSYEYGIPELQFLKQAEKIFLQQPNRIISELLSKLAIKISQSDYVWLSGANDAGDLVPRVLHDQLDPDKWTDTISQENWSTLFRVVCGMSGGSLLKNWIPQTLIKLASIQSIVLPKANLIPSIREMGPRGGKFDDLSGRGLIDRLAEIQSPDHDKRDELNLFNSINDFLREVTARKDAKIEIPHNREHVLVHIDGKVLPLASLGTGIHEVILLAAFCTLVSEQIMCIEEPELHLHPLLQRKLISYLQKNTKNQYFIATHSASFIDTPGAAVFHVSNDGKQTYVRESLLKKERFEICVDLGYRASDILQSNAVIWVEGPSDRIYLRRWIKEVAPELEEGIHYSIMFYGGRLLSHLSADDDSISEFINLRSLNRNVAVVIDSDKQKNEDAINATKSRILNEFDKGGGISWVTKGREIENYVPHEKLQTAVKSAHPTIYEMPAKGGMFDHALFFKRKAPSEVDGVPCTDSIVKEVDKVKVARFVCEDAEVDLSVLDLRERLEELVYMLRHANPEP